MKILEFDKGSNAIEKLEHMQYQVWSGKVRATIAPNPSKKDVLKECFLERLIGIVDSHLIFVFKDTNNPLGVYNVEESTIDEITMPDDSKITVEEFLRLIEVC